MLVNFALIALFLLLASSWIYIDFRFGRKRHRWNRKDANLVIFREKEKAFSETSEDDLDTEISDEAEAKLILLDDLADEKQTIDESRHSLRLALFVIASIVVLSASGYLYWGDPHAIRLSSIPEQFNSIDKIEDLDPIVDVLSERNESRRGDTAAAMYLIHAHFLKNDFESVILTHKEAETLGRTTVASDLERVQAAFVLEEGELSEETLSVTERVLDAFPDHPTVMEMFALNSYAQGRFTDARGYTERVLRQNLESGRLAYMEELLSLIHANLAIDHVGIHVTVHVENVSTEGQWLTVFANSEDSGPPLAVVRRANARSNTYSFILDDAVAMLPQHKLSQADRVRITARLSPTENVADTDSSAEVQSDWIVPSPTATVTLRLSDASESIEVTVDLRLDTSLEFEDHWPVFLIGRQIGSTGAPLFVKRVLADDLPAVLTLSSNDAMMPNARFPEEGIEVSARASSTGNASRNPRDIESETVVALPGDAVQLELNRLVGLPNQ